MFKKIAAVLLSCVLASCAVKPDLNEPKVIFSQKALDSNPDDLAFWLVFAIGKISCNDKFHDSTFGHFSCAFRTALLVNDSIDENDIEKKPKKQKSQFVKDLGKVNDAGFLNEYIFYSYRHHNWFLEPELKTEEYFQWMEKNLKNHKPSEMGTNVENLVSKVDQNAYKKIEISEDFIKSIGNLRFLKMQNYDLVSLGVSARYRIVSNINGWVDFYVYPNISSEESLRNNSGIVDEASLSKSGLLYYSQQANSKKFQVLEESFNSDIGLLKGRYEIERDGALYIDEIILSAKNNYFLKVRGTFLKGKREYSDEEIQLVFDSLLKNIQ